MRFRAISPLFSAQILAACLLIAGLAQADVSVSASPKIGPNLHGVVGRKAGDLSGYDYSPAMKSQTFVWDDAHLNRWLLNPADLVPGTAMAFGGVPSAADREAIIAYLRNDAK